MYKPIFILAFLILFSSGKAQEEQVMFETDENIVYVFKIMDQIAKPVWRTTLKAFEEAVSVKADYILLHMNTYGGQVDIADSIRTSILNSSIPVFVFIDNQAISAGALISIAADSIYMRPGGSIGAATVVNQTGEVVPDKYQSFMRSTMRATAEAHGKDTIISGNDTIVRWFRDPKIAEAMVDPLLKVEGIVDSGQVLTLTAEEAVRVRFCEGLAKNIPEVLQMAGITNYRIERYEPSGLESFIMLLLSPVAQSLLIMIIIGGIYFELQSPGIGFPLGAAILAAMLYFAPLYLEGIAQNWEILVFIAGIILVALEIFVIPGFGVAGIAGIILVVAGLTMSMVDNVTFEYEGVGALDRVFRAFFLVVFSIFVSFILSIYLSKLLFTSTKSFKGLALNTVQNRDEGYIGINIMQKQMVGKSGTAFTVLRPSGRVEIEGEIYDARAEIGFIDKGEKVRVLRDEAGQLYVIKV